MAIVEPSDRTGLSSTDVAVLRAVDTACRWGQHRPRTAPTLRALRHLRADCFDTADAVAVDAGYAALADRGTPWRLLHPLLAPVGNWGGPWGDPPADAEFTRVGLSPLGRLALDAEDDRCGPVPLGLVLGTTGRDPWRASAPTAPGFGLDAAVSALDATLDDDRALHEAAAQRLGIPPLPTGGTVDVDLAALLAGDTVTARLGCRASREPPPANPSPPPGPPPELLARMRPGESFGWVTYGNRVHAGPLLVITGTPTDTDLDSLTRALDDAACDGRPEVPEVSDQSTDRIGTRIVVHTDHPSVDLDPVHAWVDSVPGTRGEHLWRLPRPAAEELALWAARVRERPDGLQRLRTLAGQTPAEGFATSIGDHPGLMITDRGHPSPQPEPGPGPGPGQGQGQGQGQGP